MAMNRDDLLWMARNVRAAAEAVARQAEALAKALDGAEPGVQDGGRMLAMATQECADRARRLTHRIEASPRVEA